MNVSTLKTALYTWANTNAGGTAVIWSEQAAPRPTRPYITLKLQNPSRVAGSDEARPNKTTGISDLVGHRRIILSVQVVGFDTLQKAQDLNFSLGKQAVLSVLRASGISVINEGNIINITEYLETKFEQRYSFDVELLVLATGTDNAGYFDEVQITGLGETQNITE